MEMTKTFKTRTRRKGGLSLAVLGGCIAEVCHHSEGKGPLAGSEETNGQCTSKITRPRLASLQHVQRYKILLLFDGA
jgi:hypothetical protein